MWCWNGRWTDVEILTQNQNRVFWVPTETKVDWGIKI